MLKILMITPCVKYDFVASLKKMIKKNKVGKSLKHEISYNISEIAWFYNWVRTAPRWNLSNSYWNYFWSMHIVNKVSFRSLTKIEKAVVFNFGDKITIDLQMWLLLLSANESSSFIAVS